MCVVLASFLARYFSPVVILIIIYLRRNARKKGSIHQKNGRSRNGFYNFAQVVACSVRIPLSHSRSVCAMACSAWRKLLNVFQAGLCRSV